MIYNPYNGRIGSEVKSFESQNYSLDLDNPEHIKIIEKFLLNSNKWANERTMTSLIEDGQEKWGIVTAGGIIIDGNRRACLLNTIWNDKKIKV